MFKQSVILRGCISALLLLLFRPISPVQAATTIMGVTPSQGEYNQPLTVAVTIDGNGEKFNAAEANVKLTPNLAIESVTLGDCGFSFLTTPSISNPSFKGVLLAKSATKCTVYTLKLLPVATGKAAVTLDQASVRRFGDAQEILAKVENGAFNLTGAVTPPAAGSPLPSPKAGLYTVALRIVDEQGTAISQAAVSLQSASNSAVATATSNESGSITYTDIPEGIYAVQVAQADQPVAEEILNVSGRNPVLQLSITVRPQPTATAPTTTASKWANVVATPWLGLGIGAGIGMASVAAVLLLRRKKSS